MKASRRSFLAALASIPIVGRLVAPSITLTANDVGIPLSDWPILLGVTPDGDTIWEGGALGDVGQIGKLADGRARLARARADRYEPLPWANTIITDLRDEDLR